MRGEEGTSYQGHSDKKYMLQERQNLHSLGISASESSKYCFLVRVTLPIFTIY